MKQPDELHWTTDPDVLAWVRARNIVEFFVAHRQRDTITAFLAQYEGPQNHDAIRDAFRLYAPSISA